MSLSFQAWRRAKKISKRKMAELLGVHENTYRNWERNPNLISIIYAKKIAEIIGVSIDQIMFCKESND